MPKLDPDPYPPWSSTSSSEPNNISCSHDCLLMRWRIKGTSKSRKSSSKHSSEYLTEESLNEFNRRIDAQSYEYSWNSNNLNHSSSLYVNIRRRTPENESHGTLGTSNFMTVSPLNNAAATAMAMMKPVGTFPSSMEAYNSSTHHEKHSMKSIAAAAAKRHRLLVDMELMEEKKQAFNWAIKYQPKALKDFICHREKAETLHGLVSNGHHSHYIFEGPPGVGKRALVMATLREFFGPVKLEAEEECKEFKLKGRPNSNIRINVRVSSRHIEVNVSELRVYATHVLMELMKETHSNLLINQKNLQLHHTNYQAIVLYEAEKLSVDAQLCIRRVLESYSGHNKVIFCCSDISKLQHVRSLCTVIQLLPPSNMEIVEVLESIAKQEDIELPSQLAKNIAEKSKQNLQQAIRSFEATWQLNYPFNENQVIMTGWEEELAKIAKDMIKEQSPKQLYNLRMKLRFLQKYDVSPEFIFSTLVGELKKYLNDEFQSKFASLFQEYAANNYSSFYHEILSSGKEQLHKKIDDQARKNVQLYFMRIEGMTYIRGVSNPTISFLKYVCKLFQKKSPNISIPKSPKFIAQFMSVYKVLLNSKSRRRQNV